MSRNGKTTQAPQRPIASEAEIRAMHDRAASHGQRAAEHETDAVRVIREAEQAAQEMVAAADRRAEETLAEAQKKADEHVEHARAMAAQMIANGRADADRQRTEIRKDADDNVRQAHLVAQQKRDQSAAETRSREYWAALAAEETERAGLTPVATETRMDPLPEQNGAAQ